MVMCWMEETLGGQSGGEGLLKASLNIRDEMGFLPDSPDV